MSDAATDAWLDERADILYLDIVDWQRRMGEEEMKYNYFFSHSNKERRDIHASVKDRYLKFRSRQTCGEMKEKLGVDIQSKPKKDKSDELTDLFRVWFPNVDEYIQ